MSSKVGGIARAPVWRANPFLQIIAEVATTTSYFNSRSYAEDVTSVTSGASQGPHSFNSRSYAEDVTSVTSGASQGPHSFNLVFVCLFVSRLALSRICPVPYRTAGHLLAPVTVPYRTVPSNTAGYKQLATILCTCTCIRLPVCCNCALRGRLHFS